VETLVGSRERSLIDEFLRGNAASFEELVRPYIDRVYNALYRMTGNADDAAELLQETLIRAFRALGSFQGESAFYTWLFRIAINLALSKRRARKLRREVSESTLDTGAWDMAADEREEGPDGRMVREERQRLVQEGLAQIGAEHRAILVLKDIEGLKYEDIARVLEIPLGTVRSRLHRARLELERVLRPWFDEGRL
jgi:RNA polymerase sigma-70 factor (ECF subfamily)